MTILGWSSIHGNNNGDNNLRHSNIFEDRTYADARLVDRPIIYSNQPNHEFFIYFTLVRHVYDDISLSRLPCPPRGTLSQVTDHNSRHEFSLPFRYFTSGPSSGEAAVAGMISGIRSPFPLVHDNFFWLRNGSYFAAEPLSGGLAEVAHRVSFIAQRAIAAALSRPGVLTMSVTLEKRVVVVVDPSPIPRPLAPSGSRSGSESHQQRRRGLRAQETLGSDRSRLRAQETLGRDRSQLRAQGSRFAGPSRPRLQGDFNINDVIPLLRRLRAEGSDQETLSGDTEESRARRRSIGIIATSLLELFPRPEEPRVEPIRIPARRSAVEGLRRTKHGGAGDLSCAICLDDYVVGSEITWMPCSDHGFHTDCIVKWLETDHTCPICRFSLPIN